MPRVGGTPVERKAVQDFYPDDFNICYGCGQRNEHGLHLRTYVTGDDTTATFTPHPYHTAIRGYVYGGLIASLIDCHGTGTAAAAAYKAAGRDLGSDPPFRFVTAALHVDYLRPTPIGVPLHLRGRAKEVKGRKVVVEVVLSAAGDVCARGEVIAVQAPAQMGSKGA
jgi:acyl-coenzyme A thioesterase PaaI-like protein